MFCQNKGWSPGSVWDGNPSCPTSQTWAQEDLMPIALKPPQPAFPACQPSHWAVSFQAFLPSEYCAEGRTGMSLQRGILLELGRGSSGAWQLTMEMGFSICPRLFPSLCRGGIFPFHYKSLTLPQKVRRCWPSMGQWESSLSFYACLLIAVLPLLLVAHGTTLFLAILLEKTSCKVWKLLALVIWTSSPREFPLAQKGLLIRETSQSLWEVRECLQHSSQQFTKHLLLWQIHWFLRCLFCCSGCSRLTLDHILFLKEKISQKAI